MVFGSAGRHCRWLLAHRLPFSHPSAAPDFWGQARPLYTFEPDIDFSRFRCQTPEHDLDVRKIRGIIKENS